MPLHQRPELSARVRKWLGIRGSEAFDTVAPEVVPIISVGDLLPSPDIYEARAARAIQVPAGAGAKGYIGLYNPSSSGKILFVEELHFASDANQQVDALISTTAAGSAVATEWRDQRLSGSPVGLVYRGSSASPPSGNSLWEYRLLAETTMHIKNADIVLPEGYGVYLVASVVNQIVNGGIAWRERDKHGDD